MEAIRPEYDRLEQTYAKVLVSGKIKYIRRKEPLTNWMDSISFHQYESRTEKEIRQTWMRKTIPYTDVVTDFSSPGVSGSSFNLFNGFATNPSNTGVDISIIYSHIHEVLCSGDEKISSYLLDWIAHMFQKPEDVSGIAPVFISKQGAGKGILVEHLLGRIIGDNYFATIGNSAMITNQFNSIIEGKLLLNIDEASFSGNHQEAGVLKYYIGNDNVTITRKGLEGYKVKNRIRIIFSSQHDTAVRVEKSNRRYFVPLVSNKYVFTEKGDLSEKEISEYFNTLIKTIENGGREQFLYDMLNRDISNYNRFKAPISKKEMEMKEYDHDEIESWFMGCVYDLIPDAHNWTKDKDVIEHGVLRSSLPYGLYKASNPHDKFTTSIILSRRISKLLGVDHSTVVKVNKQGCRGWRVDLEALRKVDEEVEITVEPKNPVATPVIIKQTISWKEFYQRQLDEVAGRYKRTSEWAEEVLGEVK